MAIPSASGFSIGSTDPIDNRLVLTKAQMKAANDNIFPEVYLTICSDDGKVYVYNKNNETDPEIGKFREFKSGAAIDFESELKKSSQDNLLGNTGLPPSDIAIKNAMGAENGIATLDSSGHIPSSQLPTSAREIVDYKDASVDHVLPNEADYESGNEIIITASGYILRSTAFTLAAGKELTNLEINQANILIGYGYVFTLSKAGAEVGVVSQFASDGVTLLDGTVIPIPNTDDLSATSVPETVKQPVKEGDSFLWIDGHWILLSSKSGVDSVNGKTGAVNVREFPIPEDGNKLLLSTQNEETSELEWSQVDKGTIDGSAYVNLDVGSDLNTLVTHGRYRTTTKRVDRIANLPVQVAGMLTVRLTGSVIYQTYNSIDNKMYTRTSEDAGENWSDWKDVSEGGDEPFKGTHDEWDALTDEQKAQYETVIFTDDTSSGLIDDTKISRNSTWSSEEINANLGEKADYKLVVEDNNRYVEDIVTQDINTWLPNDNSSMLVNLMRKESSKYANFQLLCNKQDSINWSCIVSGAIGTLWKIRCVNGVRYVDELATMDKVASSKNRIAEKIVTMDSLDDTRTGMSIDFDADRGEIRLYVEKNGVTQKIVTFKSV